VTDIETIAAIATPPGRGAIGIVRLSGPRAVTIAEAVFRPARGSALSQRTAGTMVRGWIVDAPDAAGGADVLDEVMVVVFHAPHSYTCEDVVELHCHGGQLVLTRIVSALLRHGARPAAPGEFTRRAFLNGRIDLTQAEAVLHVIDAPTDRACRAALRQLDGALRTRLRRCHEDLYALRTELEASIEFPDDVDDAFADLAALTLRLSATLAELRVLMHGAETGRKLHDGWSVAIAGRPNAGKSTLLNCLARGEHALVTPIAGTTRDAIAVDIAVQGYPLRLIDTAGMRQARGTIEQHGVARARQMISQSDLVLWLADVSRRPLRDEVRFARTCVQGQPVLWLWAKSDLQSRWPAALRAQAEAAWPSVAVSAKTGQGLDTLETAITAALRDHGTASDENIIMLSARQRDTLTRAHDALQRAVDACARGAHAELILEDIRATHDAIGEVTGLITSDDVLDAIFATFCIGK
jgi:tRNA modification GTPase